MLGDNYQVQHAPWDVTDGGALDSKYGLQCLDMFLQTSMLEPTTYDVIIFNFGMHDINFSGKYPEEYVEPDEYTENLRSIASILLSTGAKVGFVLTTPVPFSVTLNNRVKQYNRLADAVMKTFPTVVTADLYTWVTDACGEPPYESCIIAAEQPSPHYTQPGYEYLSIRVKDLILDLVRGIDQNAHHFRPQVQYIDQAWGQDGWMLAEFFSLFDFLWTKTKSQSVKRKKGIRLISSHLDLTSFVNKRLIKFQKNHRFITNHDLLISRDRKESQLFVAQ